MFEDFLIGIFLSFFAIYGLVQTIINIFSYIGERKVFKNKTVYTIVTVKNEEEKVEGIAHALLIKYLKEDNGAYNNKICIVDLDSEDKTKEILEIVKRDKPQLYVYNKNDFLNEISKWVNI